MVRRGVRAVCGPSTAIPTSAAEAALRNRNGSFVIDGAASASTAVRFNGLHSHQHHHEVEFYAFDYPDQRRRASQFTRSANPIDPESAR